MSASCGALSWGQGLEEKRTVHMVPDSECDALSLLMQIQESAQGPRYVGATCYSVKNDMPE